MRDLIVAFSCLLLVVQCEADITSIESSTPSSTNDIGASNGPGEVNEVELAKQEKRLELRRKAEVKKWRKLKSGMTEKQVCQILGKPKLIQSSSHECVWFYQYLPVSDAKPNFQFKSGGRQKEVKDRYGTVIEKVALSNVGGIRYGIAFFEAKSLEQLVAEEGAKHKKAMAEVEKIYKESPIRKRKGSRARQARQAAIRQRARERTRRAKQAAIREIENNYNTRVKLLKEGRNPRLPIFVLRFFNQPDWPQIKHLLTRENACMITAKDAKDKWNLPHKWRKLEINMTVNEVHRLLGQPERSETNVQGRKEYSGDVSGHGELYFSARSNLEECLDSWIEPFWPAIENSLRADKTSSEENIDQ